MSSGDVSPLKKPALALYVVSPYKSAVVKFGLKVTLGY